MNSLGFLIWQQHKAWEKYQEILSTIIGDCPRCPPLGATRLQFPSGLARSVDSPQIQGGYFYCSALKMTTCQPLKEISELFLPKND